MQHVKQLVTYKMHKCRKQNYSGEVQVCPNFTQVPYLSAALKYSYFIVNVVGDF